MNNLIISELEKLMQQARIQYFHEQMENNLKEMQKQTFRIKSLKKIIGIIRILPFEIKSSKDVAHIPGIGEHTVKRIDEIIKKGNLEEVEKHVLSNELKSIEELEQIIGIGPKLARQLVIRNHIHSIQELKKANENRTILLNNTIKIGLKYYGKVKTKIPRDIITEIGKLINKESKIIDKNLQTKICGSYRREKAFSGDIDILLFDKNNKLDNLKILIKQLKKIKLIVDDITGVEFNVQYHGFIKYKGSIYRLDFLYIDYNSRFAAFLHFTGPQELNTEMRKRAIKHGLRLNQYGLFEVADNVKIPLTSEKEIFELLGMKYLTPKEREKFSTGSKHFKE